jgi:hypothetical protein
LGECRHNQGRREKSAKQKTGPHGFLLGCFPRTQLNPRDKNKFLWNVVTGVGFFTT